MAGKPSAFKPRRRATRYGMRAVTSITMARSFLPILPVTRMRSFSTLVLSLVLSVAAPHAAGQIVVTGPAGGSSSPVVTIGDGIASFGDFNGTNQQPFRLALKSLPGGGVIDVLPGHFSFDRAVIITQDDITIRGSTGAKLLSNGTNVVGLFLILGDHVRISGLQIKTNNPVANQAAILGLGDSIAVDHCLFTALGGAADFRFLQFGDGSNVRRGTLIESNTFLFTPTSNGVIGVTLRFGIDLRMVNNEFRRQTGGAALCRYAVEIDAESKGVISGNSFQNLGTGADKLDAVIFSDADTEGHHFAITGNFFENCQAPQVLHLSGGRFCTVTGNVFGRMLAATGGVIRLSPSSNGVVGESNVVSGNQFHNVELGIWVDDNLWNNITGNNFTICTTPQIWVGPNGQGTMISSNQFVGSTNLSTNIPTAITVTTSVNHLIHDNAAMSQNANFGFATVVTSSSSDASILDNFNT